ncbi:MAG: hypothetical protein EA342_14250 [Leptolyngbya sp. LCM1.Bin17]|nr:MAG: hypothetical protein EA342_14250 [Leptolyngbya sp. LCM1.Bin17]
MLPKSELQTLLKDKYGINKNVSQGLSREDCEQVLSLLSTQPSAERLAAAFIAKNDQLSHNNRNLGQRRSHAEKRLARLQADCQRLEASIDELEATNRQLGDHKGLLSDEQQQLEAQIKQLEAQNQRLNGNVQTLTTRNDELVEANDQLKRDNKDLKNAVDQIRLRLARDTKMLLQYEDSELRKALIRLFRWTLG